MAVIITPAQASAVVDLWGYPWDLTQVERAAVA